MPFSLLWHALFVRMSSIGLGLMLLAALLGSTSCTIERVILYNTEVPGPLKATPSQKIGPS